LFFKIDSLSTPTGSLLTKDVKGNPALVNNISSSLVFSCNGTKLEDKGVDTAIGYDARPIEYGLYIDVYNKDSFGKVSIPCGSTLQENADRDIVNASETRNPTCDPSSLGDKSTILNALNNNQVVRVVGYVDYKTYEITGFYHGKEHTERLTNTTDKLNIGGNDDPKKDVPTFEIKLSNHDTNPLAFKDCRDNENNKDNKVTAT